MKIALASDHRGYEAKRRLALTLRQWGHTVTDFGCDGSSTSDYPDFAIPAAQAVASGECHVGIFLDGTGIGMAIVANKVIGVYAALAHDEVTARLAREHSHCNALCLGADLLSETHIRTIVEVFLTTPFGNGRHIRRVEKIRDLERRQFQSPSSPPPDSTPPFEI